MRPLTIAAGATLILQLALPSLGDTPLQLLQVGSGLSTPTFATGAPGDTTHLYITEHGSGGSASIKVLDLTNGNINTFMTLTGVAGDNEQGLLGLAFDPNYTSNGMFYVDYVATGGTAGITRIQRFHANSATSASSSVLSTLLSIDQPQTNHNGGWIGFSNRPGDGRSLYIATGDGGNGDDTGPGHIEPGGNAQNTTTTLGKILRLNIDPLNFTTTPASNNPFAASSNTSSQMIYALGLRNPFRDSFDRATGNLYIGDVGQNTREEVDIQKVSNPGGGENYGWRLREGTIPNPTNGIGGSPPPGAIDPIIDYPRTTNTSPLSGRTIIGGYVYNGAAIPDLVGTYIFGDYLGPSNAPGTEIFSLVYDGTTVSDVRNRTTEISALSSAFPVNISSFAEDTSGELYVVDIGAGKIFKVVPIPPISASWNGTSGNWSDIARWSTNPTFPNNSTAVTYDAVISAGSVSLNVTTTLHSLTLSGGSVTTASSSITAKIDSLTIANSGGIYAAKYDLGAGKLIVRAYTATDKATKIAALNAALVAGSNGTGGYGANWTGNGITSSTITAPLSSQYAVGIFDNSLLRLTSFGGQSVNSNSILIAVAHLGDADNSGLVNIVDLTIVANNWQQSHNNWAAGDLNGDGLVNIVDFTIVADNWQQTSSFALTPDFSVQPSDFNAQSSSPIPEPASLALLSLAIPFLQLRRRRRT